ncbi:N-acetylglucosamine-6-phosphate deacetylase [Bacillus sp. AFS055030]|uniref:N-acetylglucosamine-6-phosphate deacetylase n=1 Tax=Bacillus sp. AFS055030 TaxID=2033507 RepID=UPI000BFB4873|nr:N-acetylglucosamine-6-phosphate deacetylase [Bacillus sp. AFS055030]PGL72843.1 N-acetylglucosamine-6-phosphate deacetylase [Bacillus sp. AFS055030]
MKAIKLEKIYTPGKVVANGYILIENGKISEITTDRPSCEILDYANFVAIPGLIDLHIHGIAGNDTMDASIHSLREMSLSLARHGVTGFLPTTLTHDFEKIKKAVKIVSDSMGQTEGAEIIGSYVEGPYITTEHRGAHPVKYIRELQTDELYELIKVSNNTVKVITIAPEKENAGEAIKLLTDKGIHVSIGHTNADFDTTNNAIEHGARISVHTFNGMRGFNHRDPGCLGAVLTNDQCYCECIADLQHVHPGAIKLLYKAKGIEHILLISDSMAAADLPDGFYTLGTLDVKVENKIARTIETGSLAGSTTNLMECLKNVNDILEVPLETILPMVSLNQAKLLKIDHEVGSIECGKKANIVLIDRKFNVQATFVNGELVFLNEHK